MGAPRFVLNRFWPSNLFLGGIPGAWYDPTDLSTMFQDNTGLTPVTAVEQPVGLIFDKSQGTPAARYNLLTYTEQFNDAYWFKAGGTISANTTLAPDGTTTADTWTATAGAARHELLSGIGAGPTTTANANHTFTLYVKKGTHNFVSLLVTANNTTWYVATFDFSGATPVVSKTGAGAGGVLVSTSIEAAANGFWRLGVTGKTTDAVSVCCPVLASSATPTYGIYGEENWTAAGTETAIFWGAQLQTGSTATTYQRITTGIGGEWTPGNHAYQSTAASRPTYRARYNLLTYSEQFDVVASWAPARGAVTANATVAPDGNTTADKFVEDTATGDHDMRQTASIINGSTYTLSCYFKAAERTFGQISTFGTGLGLRGAVVNLSNGSVQNMGGGYGAFTTAVATPVGNGWYRVVVTATASATGTTTISVGATLTSTGTPSYTGDGTSGLFLWGAQLLTAADVTATGNAYQRIAASTVYDTAPIFRPYLAFDGVDDSLATAAINFTSTDKMTVFAGVTKLGSSFGVLSELGNNGFFNAGNFYLGTGSGTGIAVTPVDATAMNGNATYAADYDSAAPPVGRVYSQLMDMSQPTGATEMRLRINAAFATINGTLGTSAGTGTFANAALNIGQRAGGSFRLNGRIYSLIVRGAASSTTEIIDTEQWVNQRTGAF